MWRQRREHILTREHAGAIGEERSVAALQRGHATTCLHCGRPIAGGLQINGGLTHIEVRSIRQRRVPINHEDVASWLDVITMKRKGP